jgi:hypothetical protein
MCRVDIIGEVKLYRYHLGNLSACIDKCKAMPACKGLTFEYGALPEHDDCWLKSAATNTNYTEQDFDHVQYVSLAKPEPAYSCLNDEKCRTSYILSIIGAVLGATLTLFSIASMGLRVKRQYLDNSSVTPHIYCCGARQPEASAAGDTCALFPHEKADVDVEAQKLVQDLMEPVRAAAQVCNDCHNAADQLELN